MNYKQSEYSQFWEATIPYDNYEVMIKSREKEYSGIRKPTTIKQIIESFDKVLEGQRQLLEDEIKNNIQHSLQTILKKLD